MPTRITMGMDAISRNGSRTVIVQESFDTVIEKFWPINPAGSNLEARSNNMFTSMDGKRIFLKTPSIIMIEEDVDGTE